MTLFRRHRDLDSPVAEAISRARDAGEMAAEWQRRYEQVSETVIQPLASAAPRRTSSPACPRQPERRDTEVSQDQVIILALKVVLVAIVVTALAFVGVYTYLAKWWDNEIGKTLVILDLLIAAGFIPSLMSLFLDFNRLTSTIAAWIDIGIWAAVAAVLALRIPLWIRLHLRKDGQQTYPAMRWFAAEVWRRRGRPRLAWHRRRTVRRAR